MESYIEIEQINEHYNEAFGSNIPNEEKPFWNKFVEYVNRAYNEGILAGMKKVR